MAIVQVKFLKPFLYAAGTGANYVNVKVDRDIVQMRGFVEAAVATSLINLGLAATGPTAY